MTGNFTVVSERFDSYMGKRGKVELVILALLDNDPKHRMINTVDYVLSPDEREHHAGKCQGKIVDLAVHNAATAFGGRLRLQGQILKFG